MRPPAPSKPTRAPRLPGYAAAAQRSASDAAGPLGPCRKRKKPLFASRICATATSATGTAFSPHALKTATPRASSGRANACTLPAA